jgi:tetratricopeptide (TPR) repeat protein
MIADVAQALDYAHQQGVIHRDVKPSNLLLSPDGRLWINDFGLARLLEQPSMTVTGECVGTPAYMSPEQIAGGRIPVDRRTDVYSLGVTLYELLTLQAPFRGERRDHLLAQIMHEEPKPPRTLNRNIPVDLDTICLKAMEKDPDRRYQTAGQLAEDLRRYVHRFAISARRAGPFSRLLKWTRRHPGWACTLALAALLVPGVVFFWFRAQVAEQRRLVEQEQARQQLLNERQQRALDNALAAAMSGDHQAAETAIAEAGRLGASAGHVGMLRGQVCLQRGDGEASIRHLKQAVELLPESAAARAMLATAYNNVGRWDLYLEKIREAEGIAPITPEDYVFLGYATSHLDPGRGLHILDDGIARRDSSIGRALRAQVRADFALDTAKAEDGERALSDARVAKGMLPDNPFVLCASAYAHLVAAQLFDEAGWEERRRAALEEAGRDALALARFETLPGPVSLRWLYFEHSDQDAAALEVMRRAAEGGTAPACRYLYALGLYKRAEFAAAARVLEPRPSDGSTTELFRAFVLAELPDGPARAAQAYEELRTRYPDYGLFAGQAILRLLGRKADAVASLRSLRKPAQAYIRSQGAFFARLVEYNRDELSADQLLTAAGTSRPQRCCAHYYIALTQLAEGNRRSARDHFRRAAATYAFFTVQYDWSRAFLARMQQDPAWPPWIPVKKD